MWQISQRTITKEFINLKTFFRKLELRVRKENNSDLF